MPKGALYVSWGELVPGREELALEVLQNAKLRLGQMQAQGRIECAEVVMLEPNGGSVLGFALIRGDRDALAALRVSEEFVRVIAEVELVHRNVVVAWAHTGAEQEQFLALSAQCRAELLGRHSRSDD